MGDKIIAAAAPSDGINVSTTSGGGKVIAGISVAAIRHPKVLEGIQKAAQSAADKGKREQKSVPCASTGAVLALQRKSIVGAYVLYARNIIVLVNWFRWHTRDLLSLPEIITSRLIMSVS
jgi:hypothetical protein